MVPDPLLIDDNDRYARQRLITWWDQQKLSAARVMVIGAGALGNEVLKNLALLGVGTVYVVDFDEIEESNLTRTVLFRRSDCGRPKAEVAAAALRDLTPGITVHPLQVNVITGIGLGLFRDVHVVIGCLDNREARLWVNRQCWKVGTPWIDGGIQEINGVVKLFMPPDSACYECAMTDNDYRLINHRYSCPLLPQEDLQAGKVPTTPTISSIIGGLQTQEALKLIHAMPVQAGTAMVYNGVSNQFYSTAFQRREDCLSHETYPDPAALPLAASQHSPQELFDAVRRRLGLDEPLQLNLDRDLLVSIRCPGCGDQQRVVGTLTSVGMNRATCAKCGQLAKPHFQHVIGPDDSLAAEKLSTLGVPPYDIVRVETTHAELPCLLAADRDEVLLGRSQI